MLRRLAVAFLVVGLSLVFSTHILAATLQEELSNLKGRVSNLEETSKDAPAGEGSDSISIGGGITFIIQGSNRSNADGITDDGVTDGSYSVDLEFEKDFDSKGKAFVHLETGDGAGVTDELLLFSNVNADADDSDNALAVTEAWYEHYFNSGAVTLTFGRIDVSSYIDTNEYANDETANFLADIFKSSPVIEFPDDNSAAVRLAYVVSDSIELEVVAADGDADFEDIFDDTFLAVQVNFKPRFISRDGNYRVYSWQNNKRHTKWDDASKDNEKGNGFGVSIDQQLTNNLAGFARYSQQNGEVYPEGADFTLVSAWSLGVNISGTFWGRGEDVLGVAYGVVVPSDKYKDAGGLEGKNEGHIEAYYNFRVSENISLSPDIQFITNPYGGDAANGDEDIFVAGLRAQVNF